MPHKIAVVGAGLAGLTFSYLVNKSKVDVELTLFEAGDRVGGRVYSLREFSDPSTYVEAGGSSIVTSNVLLIDLIKQMQLCLAERSDRFDKTFYENGKFTDQSDAPKILKFLMDFNEKLYQDKIITDSKDWVLSSNPLLTSFDKTPILEFLNKKITSGELVLQQPEHLRTRLSETILGMYSGNIDKLSVWGALYYLHQFRNVTTVYQIVGGNDSLPKALASHLLDGQLSMNSPVSQVMRQKNGLYSLQVNDKIFADFDFVVMTVPVGLLKSNQTIVFKPELPKAKQEAINQIGMNRHVLRSYHEMKNAFWRMTLIDKSALWIEKPTAAQLVEFPVLEAHASNGYGKFISKEDDADSSLLTEEIRTIFGSNFDDNKTRLPTKTINWHQQRFFQGGYPFPKVGNRSAYAAWLEQQEGIIFAGEACSYHPASMEGAVESAYRAIDRVNELIKGIDNQNLKSLRR